MGRLPRVTDAGATPEQRAAIDEFTEARHGKVVPGPLFQMLMNSPSAARRLGGVGAYCRDAPHLTPAVAEAAILAAVHELHFDAEVRAHERSATAAGLPADVLRGIADGDDTALAPAQAAAVEFVRASVRRQMSDAAFNRAGAAFGDRGVVDLLLLAAYYTGLKLIADSLEVAGP